MNTNRATQADLSLDRCLSELAGRIDGVLDFWTLVCLDRTMPHRHDFLNQQSAQLRQFAGEIRNLLADIPDELAATDQLSRSVTELTESIRALSDYCDMSPETIRQRVEQFRQNYHEVMDMIKMLGRQHAGQVSYFQKQTTDAEEYFHRILSNLEYLFLQAHEKCTP
jgi:hypothetical protein